MSRILEFGKSMLSQWSTYLTGGALLAIHFLWDSFFPPVPVWAKVLITVIGTIVAAYYAWREQYDRADKLRDWLIPRLEIATVPVTDGMRYRIRVNNRSRTTVRFSALLESIEPAIDHAVPVRLQITNHAEPEADIPAGGFSLVEVFVDYPFSRWDVEGNREYHDQIGLLLSGHPTAEVHVPRQRYLIRICAYPVNAGNGISAPRSFHIIPRNQQPCIFGDAAVPYQEPI